MITNGNTRYNLYVRSDSFDFDRIWRVENILKEKGVDSLFYAPFIGWKGEKEELFFETAKPACWENGVQDMLEISKAIPDCSFCIRMDNASGVMAVFFHDGKDEVCLPDRDDNMREPKNIPW